METKKGTKEDKKKTLEEQFSSSTMTDKDWLMWRKAKRDGRLTEHRKMLRSSAYRKMKKVEANMQDKQREK